jgi:hypothetical protein
MAFGLDLRLPSLPGLEDDLRAELDAMRADAVAFPDRVAGDLGLDVNGNLVDQVWARSGLSGLDGRVDITNLDGLEDLAGRLPGGLGRPDATGEVATGAASIIREEAAVMASLAAAPRIVEALGPEAAIVEVRGQSFTVAERYVDLVSGFSALRLTPLAGGHEVFAVDGLEVGSRADEVAAATLGRLQAESAAFGAMVADAAAIALTENRWVEFTGPSLGGAVAQVAAYETAQALVAAGATVANGTATGTVRLVTVDSLGGRDAAEAINGGMLDANALALIDALNLRTEGDLVSRIGSHIGATLTLPALDAESNVVQLDAADAHVNVVSLLQTLSSDALFYGGTRGAPEEIRGFARAATIADDQLIQAWLASGRQDDAAPGALQIPGDASFDATGTVWSLDADENGSVDIAVRLNAPIEQARADLVLA